MGYTRVNFRGISDILGTDSHLSLIVLVDLAEKRQLVVTCDQNMRNQLKLRMENKNAGEHLLPEVLSQVMGPDHRLFWEIRIESLQEGKYITQLYNISAHMGFDIRCSDAVLWSFVSGCCIFVKDEVLDTYSVPYTPSANQFALPVNIVTDDMLEVGLQQAIESENYEVASRLRDELKRRHAKK